MHPQIGRVPCATIFRTGSPSIRRLIVSGSRNGRVAGYWMLDAHGIVHIRIGIPSIDDGSLRAIGEALAKTDTVYAAERHCLAKAAMLVFAAAKASLATSPPEPIRSARMKVTSPIPMKDSR